MLVEEVKEKEGKEAEEKSYKVCPIVGQECWGDTCMWFRDGTCVVLKIAEKVARSKVVYPRQLMGLHDLKSSTHD